MIAPYATVADLAHTPHEYRADVSTGAVVSTRALETVLAACSDFELHPNGDLGWPALKLVLDRGHYALDDFKYAIVVPELEAAWKELGGQLKERELLHMVSMGGAPGSGWGEAVRAHDLPGGVRIYSELCDIPEPGTFLIAKAQGGNEQTDFGVVERLLSVSGEGLAGTLFAGIFVEMRTVLPRERLLSLLVKEFHAFVDPDDAEYELLVEQAPPELEPDGPEWTQWMIEQYLPDGTPES